MSEGAVSSGCTEGAVAKTSKADFQVSESRGCVPKEESFSSISELGAKVDGAGKVGKEAKSSNPLKQFQNDPVGLWKRHPSKVLHRCPGFD